MTARACTKSDYAGKDGCYRKNPSVNCDIGGGWRYGGRFSQIWMLHGDKCARRHNLPESVGGVDFRDVLLRPSIASQRLKAGCDRCQSPTPTESIEPTIRIEQDPPSSPGRRLGRPPRVVLDLIKMDVDGPEGRLLLEIDELISTGQLTVRNILIEASFVRPAQFYRFQRLHGYTFYRLVAHDRRRHMLRTGWDAYSPPGTIAAINRLASEHLDADKKLSRFSPHNPRNDWLRTVPPLPGGNLVPSGDNVSRMMLEEELFGVRAMRQVFRVRKGLSLQAWTTLMNPIHTRLYEGAPLTWLLTLDGDLTEPTLPEADWRKASPEYRAAKAKGLITQELEEEYEMIDV